MLILVDFEDKSLHSLIDAVSQCLQSFGFDVATDLIPPDAIACALDEVRVYGDQKSYREVLVKLEDAFARRRAQRLALFPLPEPSKDFAAQSNA